MECHGAGAMSSTARRPDLVAPSVQRSVQETEQTVDPPFARAMPSHAILAEFDARKRSLPLPIPETIWFEQTFANPHTRTQPVALQNHFVPAAAAGAEAGEVLPETPLPVDAAAADGPCSSWSSSPSSPLPWSTDSGASGSGARSDVAVTGGAGVAVAFGAAWLSADATGAVSFAGPIDPALAPRTINPPSTTHAPPPSTATPPTTISAIVSGDRPVERGGGGGGG